MSEGTWNRLGDGSLPTEDADEGLGHQLPVFVYNRVLLGLLIMTVVTVGVAALPFHSEAFNVLFAMVIASIKAVLVILYFMHLRFEKPILWIVAVYPLFIFGLMLVGTVGEMTVHESPLPLHGSE